MSSHVRMTASAADLVAMIETSSQRTLRSFDQPDRSYIDAVGHAARNGHTPPIPAHVASLLRRNPRRGTHLVLTGHQQAAVRLWRRHRIAYAIDRTLWEEVGDTDPGDILPANLFDQLPHNDPFIAFPEPLVLNREGDLVEHIVGVFVTGHLPTSDAAGANTTGLGMVAAVASDILSVGQCSTHDDHRAAISLMFAGIAYGPDGRPHMVNGAVDLRWTHIAFTMEDDQSIATLIDHVVAEYGDRVPENASTGAEISVTGDIAHMLRRAVSLIIYLCAENADIVAAPRAPANRRRSSRPGQQPKPARVLNVGYRIGAQLRAWRAAIRRSSTGSTGQSSRPHVRKAHFHTYRHGKGRALRKIRWLSPIPVNFHGRDADTTTVIPVG
ncbi:hypothetical protein ETD86_37405 [Nonomuraea turkmeniaca]|uniref:Uncharacterized protein n=1 Tax=Nonomuraea turkmeniaca TaxID=103838 RepID=A0A5S4F523_9ACTN|nr:hypothetical protein [Nonomuraea turkmeniaca]TMR10996.1 hypothetical protein ETD86_37405 [Nonomuraea turkmeniaca]